MSRMHAEVRLHRGFSGWYAVRVAKDGRTITDKWPINREDCIAAGLTDNDSPKSPELETGEAS